MTMTFLGDEGILTLPNVTFNDCDRFGMTVFHVTIDDDIFFSVTDLCIRGRLAIRDVVMT